MAKTTQTTSESSLLRQVRDYLDKKKIFYVRINTRVIGSSGGKSFFRTAPKGTPDLICCLRLRFFSLGCNMQYRTAGFFLAIETKAKAGEQSPEQKRMQREIERCGGRYLLCRSLEDVIREVEG